MCYTRKNCALKVCVACILLIFFESLRCKLALRCKIALLLVKSDHEQRFLHLCMIIRVGSIRGDKFARTMWFIFHVQCHLRYAQSMTSTACRERFYLIRRYSTVSFQQFGWWYFSRKQFFKSASQFAYIIRCARKLILTYMIETVLIVTPFIASISEIEHFLRGMNTT